MHKHLCPKCGQNSYSADEEYFSPCPYCGFKFSGKYGADRRHEERIKQETAIVLACQRWHLEANTIDFSQRGLGIKIIGESPLAVGNMVALSTGNLQIKAKVMWVNKLPDKFIVGLQRLT